MKRASRAASWRPLHLLLILFLLPIRFSFAFDLNDLDVDKMVSGGSKLVKAVGGIPDEDEMRIGREVAANLAARYGLVTDEAKVRYLNQVGQAVVRHCDRKKIPYHFGILRTSEINALAAPGGYIFITQGLLDTLQDESELAGVLAHEVSHVVRFHIVKAIRQANLVGAGEDLAAATGQDTSRYGELSDFSINLLSKGLSRTDELEADRDGTQLAARVGYDAYGLRRSIEALSKHKLADIYLAHFNKTHPTSKERLKAIDQTLRKQKLSEKGVRLPERFNKALHS